MALEDLDERIAELQTLRREKLLKDWEALWRRKPPKNISRILLIRNIAYKLQQQIYNRLSPSCRKALDRLIKSDRRIVLVQNGMDDHHVILQRQSLANGKNDAVIMPLNCR